MAVFVRTPKHQIVLQLTETTPAEPRGRSWEAHDVERNRGFRVTLSGGELDGAPPGKTSLGRPFTEEEITGGLGLAVERVLLTGGEKIPGPLYDVSVTCQDLYDFLTLRG